MIRLLVVCLLGVWFQGRVRLLRRARARRPPTRGGVVMRLMAVCPPRVWLRALARRFRRVRMLRLVRVGGLGRRSPRRLLRRRDGLSRPLRPCLLPVRRRPLPVRPRRRLPPVRHGTPARPPGPCLLAVPVLSRSRPAVPAAPRHRRTRPRRRPARPVPPPYRPVGPARPCRCRLPDRLPALVLPRSRPAAPRRRRTGGRVRLRRRRARLLPPLYRPVGPARPRRCRLPRRAQLPLLRSAAPARPRLPCRPPGRAPATARSRRPCRPCRARGWKA